jgi:hypothetical protein
MGHVAFVVGDIKQKVDVGINIIEFSHHPLNGNLAAHIVRDPRSMMSQATGTLSTANDTIAAIQVYNFFLI